MNCISQVILRAQALGAIRGCLNNGMAAEGWEFSTVSAQDGGISEEGAGREFGEGGLGQEASYL